MTCGAKVTYIESDHCQISVILVLYVGSVECRYIEFKYSLDLKSYFISIPMCFL